MSNVHSLIETSNENKKVFPIIYKKFNLEKFPSSNLLNSDNINNVNVNYYSFFFFKYGLSDMRNDSFSTLNTFFFLKNFKVSIAFDINDENYILSNENEFFNDYSFIKDFNHLRKSSFIDFFLKSLVDVPICFKKTKSLKRKNFEFFFLKFINLIMRKGKREQTIRFVWNAFANFFYDIFEKISKQDIKISWFDLFFIFNFNVKSKNNNIWSKNYLFDKNLLAFGYDVDKDFKEMSPKLFIKNFFFEKLTQFSPIFSYFVYNVDKNVRKFTRGKSGKYVFIWKYIAPYKRHYLTYRWFLKELKFDDNRYFHNRLYNLFYTLTYNLKQTYAWKSKNYTYAFVFKNFRKSLMTNFKTIVL